MRTQFVSSQVYNYGIWLGSRLGLKVVKIEGYLMWTLLGVFLGLLLRKYVCPLFIIILLSRKGYVKERGGRINLKSVKSYSDKWDRYRTWHHYWIFAWLCKRDMMYNLRSLKSVEQDLVPMLDIYLNI